MGWAQLLPEPVRRQRQVRALRAASGTALVPYADARALAELRMESQDRRNGPLWWRFQAESVIDVRDLFDMGGHFHREATDERIDVRHPFLHDLQLIEAMLRLPPRTQFDPVRDRPLLRDALSGLIPEAVRTRHTKSHFSSLVLAGIRADEAGLIKPLRQADAPIRDYVVPEALDRKIAVSPDKRSMLGAGSLWNVAIANSWLLSQEGAGA